jgi:large subunit ribosomal protein L25
MEQRELVVAVRSESGSSAARRLRRQGLVPGVMYGRGIAPMPLAVNAKSLRELIHAGGHNVVVRLNIENGSEAPTVMLKEIQRDAVGGGLLNVDFQKISLTEKVTAQVPVVLLGEAPGVKQGGVLDHVLREVEVECLPTAIPVSLEVNVSDLQVGHSLHVSDLAPPPDVVITNEPTDVIVTVSRVAEEVAAPAPAPEVEEEAAPAEAEAEAEAEAAEEA